MKTGILEWGNLFQSTFNLGPAGCGAWGDDVRVAGGEDPGVVFSHPDVGESAFEKLSGSGGAVRGQHGFFSHDHDDVFIDPDFFNVLRKAFVLNDARVYAFHDLRPIGEHGVAGIVDHEVLGPQSQKGFHIRFNQRHRHLFFQGTDFCFDLRWFPRLAVKRHGRAEEDQTNDRLK